MWAEVLEEGGEQANILDFYADLWRQRNERDVIYNEACNRRRDLLRQGKTWNSKLSLVVQCDSAPPDVI